jgi:hypothetical protein
MSSENAQARASDAASNAAGEGVEEHMGAGGRRRGGGGFCGARMMTPPARKFKKQKIN